MTEVNGWRPQMKKDTVSAEEEAMTETVSDAVISIDVVPYLKYHVRNNPNVLDPEAFIAAVVKNMKDFVKNNYGEVK